MYFFLAQNSKRIFLFVSLVALLAIGCVSAATIRGKVTDVADKSPLPQSTVRLLSAKDSSFVKGVTSNDKGLFSISDVRPGKYLVQVEYLGYSPMSKEISVTDASAVVRAGVFALGESSIMLKETVVTGVKTEIKVKEDTVEYNADSYKTQPNAVVEDLLKRLPGVEIDSDGKITSQGKEVTKILLDGKEFFADDPKVATKNIPVGIIDKLQVVDRKSDLARATGVDDGEDETVINLTIKKGMNNGWFGTVTAGYGTDDRYEVNAMVNHFRDGNQFTLLGGVNNTNNLGFTDGNGNRFSRFGGNNGVTTSQSIGINFNVGKDDRFRVGGDVMYSHSNSNNIQRIDRTYLFTDSTSNYLSNTWANDKGHNLRGDFRLRWEIDSLNTFEFRPNFSYNLNDSQKDDESKTFAGGSKMGQQVNQSTNNYLSHGNSFEFGGMLLFNHKFRSRPGRAFSIHLRYNMSNVREDGTTYSLNKYFMAEDRDDDLMNQVYDNHTWSNSINSRITWTEPIGDPKNTRYIQIAYSFNYRWNNADKMVYDRKDQSTITPAPYFNPLYMSSDARNTLVSIFGPTILYDADLQKAVLGDDDVFNAELSNRFRNDFFSQRIQVGFKQVRAKYNLDLGLSLNPSMSESRNLIDEAKNIPAFWVWNLAPYLRFRYKFSKASSFQASYRARSSQPSMSQLQPVADTSNPLRIVVGNPNLKPTFVNNFDLRYNDFDQEHQRSIMAMARGRFESNSIINKTTYDSSTGGQTTTYENVNGVWNVMAMGMVSLPFKNRHWQFNNHLFLRYNATKGYINGTLNSNGSFSFNESVGVAFRTDAIELELRPSYGLTLSHNSVRTANQDPVHRYGGNFYGSYYFPFGLSVNTDITFSGTKGYSAGYDNNQWLWNAAVSYQFLKGKAATIALKVYDLLKMKQSIWRTTTAAYYQDTEYNSITRYFMVTLSYKFNTFGGGKIPDNKYEDFTGGHRGGPGRPPRLPRR